jgi:hypothetical protein
MPKLRLHSISELTEKDCYQTGGSHPVRVFCNDFNHYICKYSQGQGPAYSLFNEFIAGYFLGIWQLPVPEFSIIAISYEHIQNIGMPFHYFDSPCFGSRYNNQLAEAENFLLKLNFLKKDIESYLITFLKIGLFDIWLANEDRNMNNMNLLIDPKARLFIPIDHVMIFNSQNIDKEPYQINEGDSILSSLLSERLFSRTLQHNLRNLRLRTITEFERDLAACYGSLEQILSDLPFEWHIDLDFVRSRLDLFFSESWIEDCKTTFNTCLQLALRR